MNCTSSSTSWPATRRTARLIGFMYPKDNPSRGETGSQTNAECALAGERFCGCDIQSRHTDPPQTPIAESNWQSIQEPICVRGNGLRADNCCMEAGSAPRPKLLSPSNVLNSTTQTWRHSRCGAMSVYASWRSNWCVSATVSRSVRRSISSSSPAPWATGSSRTKAQRHEAAAIHVQRRDSMGITVVFTCFDCVGSLCSGICLRPARQMVLMKAIQPVGWGDLRLHPGLGAGQGRKFHDPE